MTAKEFYEQCKLEGVSNEDIEHAIKIMEGIK